ncbi:MAG: glycosyltransferase family 4 protein [bacterium]
MTGERLKVLHCIYDDPGNPWVGGGGARRVFDLYHHLESDVDATIATGSWPGAQSGSVDGLRVRRLGMSGTYLLSRLTYAMAASRLLSSAAYDVAVVDHSAYAPVVIPRGRPVGITVHHLTGPVAAARWGHIAGGVLARMEQSTIGRARVVSATSEATARALRTFVSPGTSIVPVSSGVPDHLFRLVRHEEPFVLYLGRLDASQKGLDVLLDAFALVLHVKPDAKLRIAGRGPHEAALRARARALGIQSSVQFLGPVSDDERDVLFSSAACQVVPSRFEGFGIAAAEALAAGVPLIVSDDPSLVEIVGADGAAGRISPRGDARGLSSEILNVISDRAMRVRLSVSGRIRAERYRWEAVAAEHLHYLRQIVRADDRRAPSIVRESMHVSSPSPE